MTHSPDRRAYPSFVLTTDNYPPVGGGVSRYYAGLREAYGPRMQVVATRASETADDSGLPVRSNAAGLLRQTMAVPHIASRFPAGLPMLFGHPHLSLLHVASRRQASGLFLHGGEWSNYPFGPAAIRQLARRVDYLIVNSEATRRQWLEGVPRSTLVLHPGISRSWLQRSSPAAMARQREPAAGALRVLTVSRLVQRKRVVEIARVVRELQTQGVDLHYTVVGTGPCLPEVKAVAATTPGIDVLGDVDDERLHEEYARADAFVLCPERQDGGEGFEGFGIVYLEAAAYGLPVIAADTGGVREAVGGSAGVLVREGDWPAVRALLRSIAEDRSKVASWRPAARQWAESNSWDSRARELAAHLEHRE